MKNNFYLTLIILMLLGCDVPTISGSKNDLQKQESSKTDDVINVKVNQLDRSIQPDNLFTTADAEKILGQQAQLTDSASTIENDVVTYKSSHTAISKDQETGKNGTVYFMFEQYKQVAAAKQSYASIKTSNENHEGVEVLHNLGDEAYFHSDGQNFYFILVRKGEKMFRMKVNKVTSTTAVEEFKLIAENIAYII
jgi:hypothetical protein